MRRYGWQVGDLFGIRLALHLFCRIMKSRQILETTDFQKRQGPFMSGANQCRSSFSVLNILFIPCPLFFAFKNHATPCPKKMTQEGGLFKMKGGLAPLV